MKTYLFRMATAQDAAAILSIYAPYIRQTPITFEYEVPTLEEFTERVRRILRNYPYIVCEQAGEIIGYGYASAYHERAAYQWDADLSIYFAPEATGHGLGRQMLCKLPLGKSFLSWKSRHRYRPLRRFLLSFRNTHGQFLCICRR